MNNHFRRSTELIHSSVAVTVISGRKTPSHSSGHLPFAGALPAAWSEDTALVSMQQRAQLVVVPPLEGRSGTTSTVGEKEMAMFWGFYGARMGMLLRAFFKKRISG